MKITLMTLSLLTSFAAQAQTGPSLECNVSSNGNGKNWETVYTITKPLVIGWTALPKTQVSAYGNTFTLEANANMEFSPVFQSKSFSLSFEVTLNQGQISLTDQDLAVGETVRTTQHLMDTGVIFTLPNGLKRVSFAASCHVNPAK